ncbi:MAG: class I SAM-dependent methyltransferase [Candidatus Dormibacteraeota bacterium]|nr:class I SAM-dependent methyltransferase [Candidatus Dormibacteraeota bacterium]
MSADRLWLRETFDGVAELYDRARPDYPDRLLDDLAELARLRPDAAILEIGPGTGQLTLPLARRGFGILGVELGENLATVARRKLAAYPEVGIVTAPFETWDPGGASFDLVIAATCWHWLDPELRCGKAADVLRVGGALAVVGGGHVVPEGGDPFFIEIQDVYDSIGESLPDGRLPRPGERADQREELEGSGLFAEVEVRRYLCEHVYTAEQYIDLLETFSGHRAIEKAGRELLYRAIRERIARRPDPVVRYHTDLVLTVARLGGTAASAR